MIARGREKVIFYAGGREKVIWAGERKKVNGAESRCMGLWDEEK